MRSLRCLLTVLICCYEVVGVFLLLSYWLSPKSPTLHDFLVSRYGSGPNFDNSKRFFTSFIAIGMQIWSHRIVIAHHSWIKVKGKERHDISVSYLFFSNTTVIPPKYGSWDLQNISIGPCEFYGKLTWPIINILAIPEVKLASPGPATTLNIKQEWPLPEAVRKQHPGGHKLSLVAHPLVKEQLALRPAFSNTDRQWSLDVFFCFVFSKQRQHQSRSLWKHSCNTSDCHVINEPFHMKQS